MGPEELANRFREAPDEEEDHLERVRLTNAVTGQAGVEPAPTQPII